MLHTMNSYHENDQVGISIFKILLQVIRPKTVILGNIPGTNIYRSLHHYKDGMKIPGFLILSIEAAINFANTTYLSERILRWIEEYEAEDAQDEGRKHSNLQFVILDLSGQFYSSILLQYSYFNLKT